MTEHKKHLYYINELSDYKISDGYPDVRGWDVKDIDNRVIGKVDNLLVNTDAERVVYLDVEVNNSIIDANHDPYGRPNHMEVREFINKDGENHIIIPIGLIDINTDSNYVYTDVIDHRTFAETKRYRKGQVLDRAYEVQVLDSYSRRFHPEDYVDERAENKASISSESRIREIVREEIREYHNRTNSDNSQRAGYADGDETIVLSRDESDRERNRYKRSYDDDHFYERSEFDDKNFRKNRDINA